MATAAFSMVTPSLRDQFRSKAQAPLDLPSDVLGQTPHRSFADRRRHSSSGRNRTRHEGRSLQRVGMERLPYNMTLLIDVARRELSEQVRRR